MGDSSEKDEKDEKDEKRERAHERFDVDWRVSLKCPDWRYVGRIAAQNASKGGLFLLTDRPPAVGAIVELSIELPDGTRVQLRATVQHVVAAADATEGRSPGIGVRIRPEHDPDLLILEEMARAADKEGANGPANRARSSTELEPTEARGTMQGVVAPQKPPRRVMPLTGLRSKIVGIDFGTTFTSISVAVDSHVALIPDEQGRVLHPSIVSYPEGRAPLVGWAARPKLVQDPRRTVPSAKRLLGRTWSDPKIAGYLHSATFRTSPGPNDAILVELGERQVAIPQVCAEILGHVRDLAERRLKDRVKEVALSVPVTFTEGEKLALRKAATLAGLDVVGLVEEPVAGALAYGLGQSVNEIVAVYDFGGGTFDFSILDVSNERFRVLACDGDSWLGGDDFDLALAQAVADALWRATRVELRQRVVEWHRLLLACEEAKRTLSVEPLAYVVVDGIIEQPKRIDLRQKVDRAIFERLCRDLVARSQQIVRNTLARAGLDPQHVTQVIATGGVSRIPFVRRALEQVFDRSIEPIVNPEEAIAIGAGVRGAKLANHPIAATAFV